MGNCFSSDQFASQEEQERAVRDAMRVVFENSQSSEIPLQPLPQLNRQEQSITLQEQGSQFESRGMEYYNNADYTNAIGAFATSLHFPATEEQQGIRQYNLATSYLLRGKRADIPFAERSADIANAIKTYNIALRLPATPEQQDNIQTNLQHALENQQSVRVQKLRKEAEALDDYTPLYNRSSASSPQVSSCRGAIPGSSMNSPIDQILNRNDVLFRHDAFNTYNTDGRYR